MSLQNFAGIAQNFIVDCSCAQRQRSERQHRTRDWKYPLRLHNVLSLRRMDPFEGRSSAAQVTQPPADINLLRTACCRRAQFFPSPDAENDSVTIIGHRDEKILTASFILNLSADSMEVRKLNERWCDPDDLREHHRNDEFLFGDFDSDNDCDLNPSGPVFQVYDSGRKFSFPENSNQADQ